MWAPAVAVVLGFAAVCYSAGAWLGAAEAPPTVNISGLWADDLAAQRADLATARSSIDDQTHAIARRLAQLQAHVIRLDAAGERLTEIADLDAGEFDFERPPPVGGPESDAGDGSRQSLADILGQIDAFERQLADRERQMRVLEDLLLASRLQKEVKPSAWPIETGFISSGYGTRTDPFNGRRSFHQGLDFAGREGSPVLAAASGIVTEVGTKFGYGTIVEINHGNGYVTRYGHNKNALVKVGDRVRMAQPIATVGSTGRATGPHVHFEVLLNGSVVDPSQYIRAAR